METAASGPEALVFLTERHFDLYLLDIKMPGMDGLEVLAKIKEAQSDATVIMITAHGSIQTAVEAMKRGAVEYLCKPFDPTIMVAMVKFAHSFGSQFRHWSVNITSWQYFSGTL